jgi:hypothetical protein
MVLSCVARARWPLSRKVAAGCLPDDQERNWREQQSHDEPRETSRASVQKGHNPVCGSPAEQQPHADNDQDVPGLRHCPAIEMTFGKNLLQRTCGRVRIKWRAAIGTKISDRRIRGETVHAQLPFVLLGNCSPASRSLGGHATKVLRRSPIASVCLEQFRVVASFRAYGPLWTFMDLYGPLWTFMDL